MKTFLDDGNQHAGANRNPNLRLHGVLAGIQKRLDTLAGIVLAGIQHHKHANLVAEHVGIAVQKRVARNGGEAKAHVACGRAGWLVPAE